MFAIVKSRAEKGLWAEDRATARAPLGPTDVRVKVTHAGICGTDFHIYQWDSWAQGRIKTPRVLGHEFVGRVVEVGSAVTHLAPGQRVSAECHVTCGVCKFCRTGRGHICQNTSIIGVDRDGAFTGEIVFPASNAWPVHDSIPDPHAAIFDPTGNAMHTVMATNISGQNVLITGAGAIGLMATAIAKANGARQVFVLEPQPAKRELALKVGADLALDPRTPGTNDEILRATDGYGPDVLLEMSGNEGAITNALGLLAMGGTAVMLGLPGKPIQFDLAEKFIFKGLTMKGVIGRLMYDTWYQVDAFMRRSPHVMDTIVTHVLPAARFAEGFDMMEKGTCGKVVLKFEE